LNLVFLAEDKQREASFVVAGEIPLEGQQLILSRNKFPYSAIQV